jgi:hypothetical protein
MKWLSCMSDEIGDCLAPELSDANGPARPHAQLTWPARVRSSDFVMLVLLPRCDFEL